MNEKKYEIKNLKNPVKKNISDVKKYDVTRFEFGDYDNWVNAVILDVKVETRNYGPNNDREVMIITFDTAYGYQDQAFSDVPKDGKIEIVGKATPLTKTKTSEDESAMTM